MFFNEKAAAIGISIILIVILNSIGFYYAYETHNRQQATEIYLKKTNIDLHVQNVENQIDLLAQSITLKNAIRFNVKDVLENTIQYIFSDNQSLTKILIKADALDLSFSNNQNESDIKLQTAVKDAGKQIALIHAELSLDNVSPNEMYFSKTHSSNCSKEKIYKSELYLCQNIEAFALFKSVFNKALIYLSLSLSFGLLFYLFYRTLLNRWTHSLILLSSKVRDIALGDYTKINEDNYNPIFKFLIKTINKNIEKIEEAANLKQQMIEKNTRLQIYEQLTHDIKSPLTALKIALSGITKSSDQTNLMLNALKRAEDILQTDERTSDVVRIDTAVYEVLEEKQLLAGKSNIELQILSEGLYAKVDLGEFKRLLSNIINNAIEASDSNSKIEVLVYKHESLVGIQISDHGKGIAPSDLDAVFTRGFTKGKNGGQGLGLHHAHTMVKSWGGTIEIRSELNKGTIVKIELPARQSTSSAKTS